MYLDNPNLHLCLVLIDADEYRLLNGWSRDRKKGSSRFDRIPVELVDELYIGGPADYRLFVPEGLPENYTSKDFAKAAHIPVGYAQTLLGILYFLHVVERTRQERALLPLLEIHSKPLSNIISGYAARQIIPPAMHFRDLTYLQTCLLLSAQLQFHSPGFQLLRCLTWIISLHDRRNHTQIPAIGIPSRTSMLSLLNPPIALTAIGTASQISRSVSVEVSIVLTFVVVG